MFFCFTVTGSDCGSLPPLSQYCWSWCWAVHDRVSRGSTSWALCDTSPDTVPSKPDNLERPPAAGWGSEGSRPKDRATERSRVPGEAHKTRRGSSGGHPIPPRGWDKGRTQQLPPPAAGNTGREGRRPLKPRSPSTASRPSHTHTCSRPRAAPAEAARWWPLGPTGTPRSSFPWRSPGGPGVYSSPARDHRPLPAWRGDGGRARGNDGWRRRGGRRRSRGRCRSIPNQSARTIWKETRKNVKPEERKITTECWYLLSGQNWDMNWQVSLKTEPSLTGCTTSSLSINLF